MKIIFKNQDNSIGIITPAQEVLDTVGLIAVAEKDVPFGLPYWIVDESVIPTDRTARNQWRLDGSEGEPHGYGGESHEFEVQP